MTLLLTQMAIILLITVTCGWLALKVGQARVIGEIIGGILIGPSVFGRLAPHLSAHLFPVSSFGPFETLSTVGLVLFLFLIGMELDYEQLYRQRMTALIASGMSILLPFAMAALLAHSLRIRFAPHGIGSIPFVLFLGIAMSITAFPVLARILEERNLQGTALGTTAILCAAVDDVVAWSLLAFALAFIGGEDAPTSLVFRLGGLVVYLFLMLGVIRPFAAFLVRRRTKPELTLELLGVVVAGALLSAAATDKIGVHPLFGAFLAGVCFPRVPHWQLALRERLDMLVSVLLLPLFFALTGMRTRLDLLNDTVHVALGGGRPAGCGLRQGGGRRAGRPVDRAILERCFCLGSPAEYPRPGGAGRAQHCLHRGGLHSHALYHAGGHGIGHDDADYAGTQPAGHPWHGKETTGFGSGVSELGMSRDGVGRPATRAEALNFDIEAFPRV